MWEKLCILLVFLTYVGIKNFVEWDCIEPIGTAA
jgi:hypothetical protein